MCFSQGPKIMRDFFFSKISTEERLCLVWLHFLCVLQKYLQQLWDTVLLVALILSTGVIVQARWQYQDHRLNDDLEVLDFTDSRLTSFIGLH